MSSYTQLLNNLDKLEMPKMKELLPAYLDKAIIEEKSITDILNILRRLSIHDLKK